MPRVSVMLALTVLVSASAAAQDPVAATQVSLSKAKADAASRPRAPMIPRETFLRRARIVDVKLSPSGGHVSFIWRNGNGADLVLQDLVTGRRTRIVAGLQRAETAWSGDGARLWLADEQGLVVVEHAGLKARRVLKWDARKSQRFFGVDARAPQYAIMHEMAVEGGVQRQRYLTVDERGNTRLVIDAALPVRSILLDESGRLAYSAAFEGPQYRTVIREHVKGGVRGLMRCGMLEECRLVGYGAKQEVLWVLSAHGEDKLSLRRWQKKSGRWDVMHRDPESVADAGGLLWSSGEGTPLAVSYHGGTRRWYGRDARTRAVLSAVQKLLPRANLGLSVTDDGAMWLVHAQQSDRSLDRYYIYAPKRKQLVQLFAREDAAARMPLGASMHPVTYRASDGMLLHGYVLLPDGVAAEKAPLVAWIHGGPITRVYDEYEGSMQMLVNRGIAVFVPNFRASTGYGMKYVVSAKGDVGNGRVLRDIVEGMDFLLAGGVGDRTRQAVMGISFGGYASLLAVSHYPTRFRFAFAGAPPTDYGWIKEWQAENETSALRAGDPPLSLQFPALGFRYEDPVWREKMRRESPVAAIGALKSPLYVWAGARDDRVPLKSVVNYVGEVRRLGKPVTLLIDPEGGHGPTTQLGVEGSLYMIEVAASRHFGGEVSPVSPELREFLKRNLPGL